MVEGNIEEYLNNNEKTSFNKGIFVVVYKPDYNFTSHTMNYSKLVKGTFYKIRHVQPHQTLFKTMRQCFSEW